MKEPGRMLGVSFMAVLVLMVLGISSADASAAEFHSEASPTWWTGAAVTTPVFTFNGGTVKCKTVSYASGELVGVSQKTLEVTPKYSECTGFGLAVTVNMGTCKYKLSTTSVTAGKLEVVPSTCEVLIEPTTHSCEIRFKIQNAAISLLDYRNEGISSSRDIIVNHTVSEMPYTTTNNVCGPGGSNGKLGGEVALRGYSNATTHINAGLPGATERGVWIE